MDIRYESMNYDDPFLCHYGVAGMKWGERRFQNKDGSWTSLGLKHRQAYEYKSWGRKHNEKKSAKLAKKIAKTTDERKRDKLQIKKARFDYRAKRIKELDRREQEYAHNQNLGANLLTRAITRGSIGGKSYQMYLAMLNGTSKKGITGKKALAAVGAYYTGRLGSTIAKTLYSRHGEEQHINALRKRKQNRHRKAS